MDGFTDKIKPGKYDAVGHPDCARRGNASEAEFIGRASALGFRTAKPWGNGDPYDVLVGVGRGFLRVQVKSTARYQGHAYRIKGESKARHYSKDNIDFLAVHIVPENVWYIVPVEAFAEVRALHFNPRARPRAKYEKYREAWCLLACTEKARGWNDIPVVCRCRELAGKCAVCPNN
jgi:hypothetical protein